MQTLILKILQSITKVAFAQKHRQHLQNKFWSQDFAKNELQYHKHEMKKETNCTHII